MSLENPVIAVIGAGAVGGYYGARLAQAGHNVHLHMRTDWKTVRENGLRIQSLDGDFHLSPDQFHVYGDTAAMPQADLVLITLKTTANDLLDPLIRPLLKPDSILITLQNGLGNEQRLADLFGADRILGGMAFVCINRIAAGVIRHFDHGMIALAEFTGEPASRTRRLDEMFTASRVPCKILPDLARGRWEKLIWNVPFNGLGALLRQSTDRLIHSQDGLALVRPLMREVIAIAAALGIDFPISIIEQKIKHTETMGTYKTSMQLDRELGRPMEIETILAAPLEAAHAKGVATPCMEMLYRSLRRLEMTGK